MTLFRVLFYGAVRSQITPDIAAQPQLTLTAFIRGLWFDNVIACYIMVLPLVVTCILSIGSWWKNYMYRALNLWFGILYTLVFMAEAGNIPYFSYFSKMLNASIWNWASYGGTTLGMIFGETSYYLYIASFAIATIAFSGALRILRHKFTTTSIRHEASVSIGKRYLQPGIMAVVLIAACLLGIRGRLGYNPIKVSAAYFSTSPVLNNLGVNPMFSLLTSTLDELRPENKTLHLMPAEQAIHNVQLYYHRNGISGISPIAREVRPHSAPIKRNVAIVLMESMSAKLMSHFGNTAHLTGKRS